MKILSINARDVDFINYRKDVSKLLAAKGFEFVVACELTQRGANSDQAPFKFRHIKFQRGSINPLRLIKEISALRKIIKEEKCDVYICYSYKLSLIAALASLFIPLGRVHVLTGMGYSFTSAAPKAKALRFVAIACARLLFKKHALVVLNEADAALVKQIKLSTKIRRMDGEGIDPDKFCNYPEPSGTLQITYVGRMLRDKGIMKFLEIGKTIESQGISFQINLVGERDEENPESLGLEEWTQLTSAPFIRAHGYRKDIEKVWKESHVCVLLSDREGMPQSLLEAIVCKRVIVAADIPACREIVEDNKNGFLVPNGDPQIAAEKILELYENPHKRRDFTEAAYAKLLQKFSASRIMSEYLEILDQEVQKV